jgi:hypothetical protein
LRRSKVNHTPQAVVNSCFGKVLWALPECIAQQQPGQVKNRNRSVIVDFLPV